MISQSVKDWTENPVITSIDTVEAPIDDISYPALSVCHKQPHFHQNWQLPEVILNFIDINSNPNDEKVKMLVSGLSNFTDTVLDSYVSLKEKNTVDTFKIETIFANLGTSMRMLSEFGNLQVTSLDGFLISESTGTCKFESAKDAQIFHCMMKSIGKFFNTHVSLYDVPKLFNLRIPPSPPSSFYVVPIHNHAHLPTYTLCDIDPKSLVPSLETEHCRNVWMNITNDFQGTSVSNPNMINDDVCGSGLNEHIG